VHRQDNGKVCGLEESAAKLIIKLTILSLPKLGHYVKITGAVPFVVGIIVMKVGGVIIAIDKRKH